MKPDRHEITDAESEALAEESSAARLLDAELASGLGHAPPAGATSSGPYLRGLGHRPPLGTSTELELVRAAQRGDPRAREQLVEACLPLIAGIAHVYRTSPGISRVELMQEGVVGILRALERFDPTQGTPFRAYAAWWVRQAMQQLVAELTRPIVLSDRALRRLARLKAAHRAHVQEHRHEPTAGQLAAATGLSEAQVADLMAVEGVPQSLEEPVPGAEGAISTLGELLDDPLAAGAYERLLDEAEIDQVRALMASLSERERTVLRRRYGLEGPEQSLREVGDDLGLSGERVRQIEQRALGKLRAAAASSAG